MDSQVHSNPFAEMSEEQKEYEAVQLVHFCAYFYAFLIWEVFNQNLLVLIKNSLLNYSNFLFVLTN